MKRFKKSFYVYATGHTHKTVSEAVRREGEMILSCGGKPSQHGEGKRPGRNRLGERGWPTEEADDLRKAPSARLSRGISGKSRMKIALFAYSRQGCRTARRVTACFPEEEIRIYTAEQFTEYGFLPMAQPADTFYRQMVQQVDVLIFVGLSGLVSREITAYLREAERVPAVLSVAEEGEFVLPFSTGDADRAEKLASQVSEAFRSAPIFPAAAGTRQSFGETRRPCAFGL